jgi:pimeloyl-ACP methyl ester carboxylesterase
VSKYAAKSAALCDTVTLELFDTATHWFQHGEPAAVNERLVRLLGAVGRRA